MNYSDLRIMNHVKCSISNDAAFYQVLAIDALNNKCILSGARESEGWIHLSKIRPAKVTVDLMEEARFSFKDNGIGWNTYSKGIVTLSVVPVKTKDLLLGYSIGKDYRYIRYAHELENLYFILTGVELYC